MARTQEDRRAQTRALLIAAAADLFARKGFHAVSAEAVADAADRTTGALYDHFGGKDGLLLALVEQWKAESAARILVRVEEADDLDGRLRALWTDSIAPHELEGDVWLLLEFELFLHAARDPVIAQALTERYAEARASLAVPLVAWAKAERLPVPRDPERTAGLVIGLLLGMAMQHRVDPTAFSPDDIVAGLRSLIQGGAEA
jgi:AcrR family transcriptional regulator